MPIRRRAVLFLPVLVAAAIAAAAVHAQPQSKSHSKPQSPPRRVLFIGNSYTYFNNLPEMLRAMAASRGNTLDVAMATTGGWKLSDHWTNQDSDAHRLLRDGKWDAVVLQEQSVLGSSKVVNNVQRVGSDDQFQRYAKLWQEEIHRAGAMPVFYVTWARKGAPEDQTVLDRAYTRAARDASGMAVLVGRAWKGAREHHANIELFIADGSHPSPAGTYLAACTFFAALFDTSPVGLPATITGAPIDPQTDRPIANKREALATLSVTEAIALQQEAFSAWQDGKRQR
jgi:hypothetical protein